MMIVMRVVSVEAGFGTTRRVIPNQMSWSTLRDGEQIHDGTTTPQDGCHEDSVHRLTIDGKAHKWYKSYHLQISSKDAYRVRGIRQLDPTFATWERFEASLRSSFGERITRDQAVREWHKLRHSHS